MVHYTNISVEETLKTQKTSISGLSTADVKKRQDAAGLNRLQLRQPLSAWKILLGQFANFIIYLLLFAVIFSIIIGEYTDSLVILTILLMNSMIGFFQEYKANRSLEKLINMVKVNATVTRDGKIEIVDAEQLVCGDIIQLENGDKVPADARLIGCTQLQVDESALTGESAPVEKQTSLIKGEPGPGDQTNMVFSATTVVNGRGIGVVTACGMATEIGRISKLVAETEEEKTPLQKRLDHFGKKLGIVIITICILVFTLSLGRLRLTDSTIDVHIFMQFAFIAISLAVAAVPTALPAVVTIALSIGTRRLLAKNMLVRRLTSVETLGSCNVVCSDKTGTLTKNEMTVAKAWTFNGDIDMEQDDVRSLARSAPGLELLFKIGTACNNSDLSLVKSSPTEHALLVSAQEAGVSFTGERLHEKPFDSNRKCMSVIVREDNKTFLFTKGAPDRLLNTCSRVLDNSQTIPLDDRQKTRIFTKNSEFACRAMRVIAFAFKEIDTQDSIEETELVFVGLQAMQDPPREDVEKSIRRAEQAHIRVMMITGDHLETATAIARHIGITGDAITGHELDGLNEKEFEEKLATTNIFARVVPEHKQKIVRGLQARGHVVAMTGDGVNDAPALKKADIGIAVGSGTDVAKEASDFVLLDDSFTSIIDGVEEGRGIYDNIQKSIMLLLSGNLMEVLIIFLAVLLGFNLPLTAVLLLWINLITDGAPALAYSVDPYGTNIMNRHPIPIRQGILPPPHLRLLSALGCSGALIGLALFHYSGGNTTPVNLQRSQTLLFNFVVLYEMVLVFVIRQNYHVELFSNRWLWVSVLFSVLMQVVIMYTPVNTLFRIVPLSSREVVLLILASALFAAVSFCIEFIRKKF